MAYILIMTHTHAQLATIKAATEAGVFDTEAFLDFANQDCYQSPANSVHPGHVMASVVASCVIKIRAAA